MAEQPNQIILENNRPAVDHLIDMDAHFGPLELNLLERVETGLVINDNEPISDSKNSNREKKKDPRFESKKEIIFVTGWVNVDSMYERYTWGFLFKILIGISIASSLVLNRQNFFPVVAVFVSINAAHLLKNLFFIFYHRRSSAEFKSIFYIEFNISLSYLIYFVGFFLLYTGEITNRFLPLFSLPVVLMGIFMFLMNTKENTFLSQKKFQIFESLQLLMIALKFSEIGFINWNYTLLFFMSSSIYMTVLGILLSIILSCTLFGFLYRNIRIWKIKSLIWMTWYYLWSGLVNIYFIKGIVQLYQEEDFYEPAIVSDYANAKSNNYEVLFITSVFMTLFSLANLTMHMIWKKEIKRYLASIIYKEELRKEVSLRMFKESFTFNMMKVSATYFIKQNKEIEGSQEQASKSVESEMCEFCCLLEPDIVLEKCGHGGICKQCLIKYLTQGNQKCPWCKSKIDKVLLTKFCNDTNSFKVKGEIDIKV